jgi:hypothetical protein
MVVANRLRKLPRAGSIIAWLIEMPISPAYWARFWRWICVAAVGAARDWAAYRSGCTVPEVVCRRCGYRPESEAGTELKYHIIALALIVVAFQPW